MYQRSSTHIVSAKAFREVLMGGLYSEDGPPTDLADLISGSFPHIMMAELGKRQVQATKEIDRYFLAFI
jgi:hypothetical protein